MINRLKVSTKISLLILAISLVAVICISFFSYDYQRTTIQDKFSTNLNVVADNRASQFKQLLDHAILAANTARESGLLKQDTSNGGGSSGADDLAAMMGMPAEEPAEAASASPLDENLQKFATSFGVDAMFITSSNGSVVGSSDKSISGTFADPDGESFRKGMNANHFTPIRWQKKLKSFVIYLAAPLDNNVLFVRINLAPFYKQLIAHAGLGKAGEVTLTHIDPSNSKITILNSVKFDSAIVLLDPKLPLAKDILAFNTSAKAELIHSTDQYNQDVYLTMRKIQGSEFILISKALTSEAFATDSRLTQSFIYASLCVAAVAFWISLLLARSLVRPLYGMRNTLGLLAQGVLPEDQDITSRDEFGQMGEKVNELVHVLRNSADFAKRIGEGKYDTEFKTVSDNDILGMSLLTMRQNLIENEKRDKERNWIVRGVAEISEILRMHDSIDTLGDDVIKFILEKINAIQGAFYVVNDDQEPPRIEMRASFAYNRKKYLNAQFRFAEGLVGQAAAEKDTILRTEIPDDYVSLTSGILGDQKPSCILIVPLITNEEVYGVLEFAGFGAFEPAQVNFVKELSLILARTIFNIKVNERTRRLLAESQEMSNELKEKQEVLRQNAEEMQATQEELKHSNVRLEEQIEEVNRTQKRMQLLLENASEVITICEEDGTIRYISPSVETILGYGQKELIGVSDLDNVHKDYKAEYQNLFTRMQENPDEKVTIQYEYRTKDGQFIWIESTGTNCMSNPAIHGYILNSRDITERRRAELEQRMRSKMQALSENSPDLITRLENGTISYINPVIEDYTGNKPSQYLGRDVKETELDFSILDGWLKIVEEVNNTSQTVSTEMDFPSEMGSRIMQVNAIPEFDELNKLESVLVVSHDITDRKLIELEIQNKNKKITESINYAKRIQTAILPNNRVISRALPDSFILYKPRDVVSGDFPWFVQIKEEIFIAAVDCTGHGVPGALLSLIGYFLLNDIVRSRKITEPGKILDLLDEGVTTTLRQDEDSTTKDGMDIALCKINTQTRVVEYAGAHRPLYIMKNSTMEEVKGNKFPIGGGIFKNQTNFTNTRLELNAGDSIYFSSDGFPDQFGGPEVRKFGPKKVRDIIERVHKSTMDEASVVFDQEWEAWRGDHKQTDDVLLIGIKL